MSLKAFSKPSVLLSNFGPLLVFYGLLKIYGLKAAVAGGMIWSVGEFFVLKIKQKPITFLFWFSFVVTVVFGAVDLLMENPFFIKLEASITNLMVAGLFGATLFRPRALIAELAQAQGTTSIEWNPDKAFLFRVITGVWVIYFVMKAAVFLWLNFNYAMDEAIVLRTIVGTGSFIALMIASVLGGRPLAHFLYRRGWMPSQKDKTAETLNS